MADIRPNEIPYYCDQIPEEYNVVGKTGMRRLDGYEKASGKAMYTRDYKFPGMLYARWFSSIHAHATIKSMDTSKAEAFPGVRYVLRYDDPHPVAGSRICPQKCYHEGEPMGAVVVADSEDIAEQAVRLIEVEWDVHDFAISFEDATAPGAPLAINPRASMINEIQDYSTNLMLGCVFFDFYPGQVLGDVEQGFAEADKIIEFSCSRQENQGHVEPHSSLCWWKDDHAETVIHSQGTSTGNSLAFIWGGNQSKVYSHPVYNGGLFGGGCMAQTYCLFGAMFLSQRLGKPIKAIMDARQSHWFSMSNDAGKMDFKVGCKNDGTITAVKMSTEFLQAMAETGMTHIIENTRIPNLLCDFKSAFVHRPYGMAFRSEQRPNTTAMSVLFGHVAAALDMDPTEVSLKNDGAHGHDTEWLRQFKLDHGFADRDSLSECVAVGREAMDWENKLHAPGAKLLSNGKYHGVGFTWTHSWSSMHEGGSVGILIRKDGSANIIGTHADIGVNAASSYCQLVAEEIGFLYKDVFFKPHVESGGFYMAVPGGGTNMCANGMALRKACKQVRDGILETATHVASQVVPTYHCDNLRITEPVFPGLNPEELDIKDSVVFEKANPDNKKTIQEVLASTSPHAWFAHDVAYDTQGPIFAWGYHSQGVMGVEEGRERISRQAHFAEVEVDTETGEIEVTKVVNVNDAGKVISPESFNGQQYGGTVMGISRGKYEEVIYDVSTGVRLNTNLLDYKYSTMRDCGPIDCHIVETNLGYGPYGAEGIAESCADVLASIIGPAVYNAIGVWLDDYPITPDKVLKALGKA